jgi:hypothetical protein
MAQTGEPTNRGNRLVYAFETTRHHYPLLSGICPKTKKKAKEIGRERERERGGGERER